MATAAASRARARVGSGEQARTSGGGASGAPQRGGQGYLAAVLGELPRPWRPATVAPATALNRRQQTGDPVISAQKKAAKKAFRADRKGGSRFWSPRRNPAKPSNRGPRPTRRNPALGRKGRTDGRGGRGRGLAAPANGPAASCPRQACWPFSYTLVGDARVNSCPCGG